MIRVVTEAASERSLVHISTRCPKDLCPENRVLITSGTVIRDWLWLAASKGGRKKEEKRNKEIGFSWQFFYKFIWISQIVIKQLWLTRCKTPTYLLVNFFYHFQAPREELGSHLQKLHHTHIPNFTLLSYQQFARVKLQLTYSLHNFFIIFRRQGRSSATTFKNCKAHNETKQQNTKIMWWAKVTLPKIGQKLLLLLQLFPRFSNSKTLLSISAFVYDVSVVPEDGFQRWCHAHPCWCLLLLSFVLR